jgi:hypothetical protein
MSEPKLSDPVPPSGDSSFASNLPPNSHRMSLLGVDYVQMRTSDGGELYLTEFGLPFWKNLLPENWYAPDWFEANRQRLQGTSMVYKVPTRKIDDTTLHLVVKWSRVGEAVPLDTLTINKFINAEFNSPFEEFSLVMELRRSEPGGPAFRIRTQKPLAIYVPGNRLQLWQTGRSEDKINAKIARHPSVEIDILRQYVVIFGWVNGTDVVEAAGHFQLQGHERAAFLARITSMVTHELAQKGYRMIDMKPAHVIVRPRPDKKLLRERHGQLAYALIDYELLERTREHEQSVRKFNRINYLKHMVKRFEVDASKPLPEHLHATSILGVDYIFGHAESTGGLLWVVGRDPELFNYFLPERWRRTPKRKLSSRNQVYSTRTKDDINLVWKVSRIGDSPWLNNPEANQEAIKAYGFNSPFEEFAYALELFLNGVSTVYPRAIYMTGPVRETSRQASDLRHYDALAGLRTPEGEGLLRKDRDYITIWGFWNGPDELHAEEDGHFYSAYNAREAFAKNLISKETLQELIRLEDSRLIRCGFEDLNPKPDHLLVSFDEAGNLVKSWTGIAEGQLCNFELIRKLPSNAAAQSV